MRLSDNWTQGLWLGPGNAWLVRGSLSSAPRDLIGCKVPHGHVVSWAPFEHPLIGSVLNLMRQSTQVEDPLKLTSYVHAPPSHRLLFRGSLSIPDSRLLLEGLSFTIPIDNTRSPGINLLKNSLALALESMRGLTLALSGISRVDSVQLDSTAEVDVWVYLS